MTLTLDPNALKLDVPLGGIRCPKCQWRPLLSSRWYCTCGHCWNTFLTAGKCPRCAKQWLITACHACHRWSDHVDWYEEKPAPPQP